MPRIFKGWDSTDTACVKVMKDSADDPFSTPDADRHKFAYNSKDHKVGEIAAVMTPIQENTGNTWVYTGGAGTSSDFVSAHLGHLGEWNGIYRVRYETRYSAAAFPDLDYYCPLVDYKYIDADGKGVDLSSFGRGGGFGAGGGYYVIAGTPDYELSVDIYAFGAYQGTSQATLRHVVRATGSTVPWGDPGPAKTSNIPAIDANTLLAFYYEAPNIQFPSGIKPSIAVVWNLPGDNTPLLQAPALAPVDGQRTVIINPTTLKVAKPGYDVDTATKQQLAFSAEKRPAKFIAADDIAVAATSTTTYDIGFTVDASVYLDVQFYAEGGDVFFPTYPDAYYSTKYYISGSTIYFENPGAAIRARFIVIAVDALGPSTGPNKVWRQFEEGGEQVTQLLAPGSAEPPRLSDIVVDSRWPTLPILAEGYFQTTTPLINQTNTIDFDNPGLLPFVKMSVVRQSGTRIFATQPVIRRLLWSGLSPNHGGDSVYAQTTSPTQVVFKTFSGMPINRFHASGTVVDHVSAKVIGIRYYIFGIPV